MSSIHIFRATTKNKFFVIKHLQYKQREHYSLQVCCTLFINFINLFSAFNSFIYHSKELNTLWILRILFLKIHNINLSGRQVDVQQIYCAADHFNSVDEVLPRNLHVALKWHMCASTCREYMFWWYANMTKYINLLAESNSIYLYSGNTRRTNWTLFVFVQFNLNNMQYFC